MEYKMPEIEYMKALSDDFFTKADKFIDTLKETRKQLDCTHSFSDEYHETTCYKCGLDISEAA